MKESCDGTNFGGKTCASYGVDAGSLSCDPYKCTVKTSGCYKTCGDGTVNGADQCDGAQLGGASCQSLGFAGGTLRCKSTCTFDTSACFTSAALLSPIVNQAGALEAQARAPSGDTYVVVSKHDAACGNFAVVRIRPDGTPRWEKCFSIEGQLVGPSVDTIGVDAAGNAIITGQYDGAGTFDGKRIYSARTSFIA